MRKKQGNLSNQEFVNFLQRMIIVQSYIYYELNENVLSDADYNELVQQLLELKSAYPDLWKKSEYFKQYGADYDGSTGFDLYLKLDSKQKEIIQVIANHRPK